MNETNEKNEGGRERVCQRERERRERERQIDMVFEETLMPCY